MIPELPADALPTADAGFVGYDLCADLHARGVKFLWRVGSGVRLLSELGDHAPAGKNLVWLWPQDRRDRPPLRLRLIRIGRGRKQCWLRELLIDGDSSRGWRGALRAALAAPPPPGQPRQRTRQTWVRKKTTEPPGAPRIRPATPAELQAAAALMAAAAA